MRFHSSQINFSSETATSPAEPLIRVLMQLEEVILALSDDQYVVQPVGPVQSCVGAHVRHCLDHVKELLSAVDNGEMNYDRRDRGTPVESSRVCAIELIADLRTRLLELGDDSIDRPIELTALLTSDGPPMRMRTSFGRELAFVLSHTIHHHALVAAMVKTLGGWLPERFGYAPATIAFAREQSCVRSA